MQKDWSASKLTPQPWKRFASGFTRCRIIEEGLRRLVMRRRRATGYVEAVKAGVLVLFLNIPSGGISAMWI